MEVAADTRLGYPRVNGTITIDLYLVRNVPLPAAGQQAEASGEPGPSTQPVASREEPDNEAR
jgi:hypothetical protein